MRVSAVSVVIACCGGPCQDDHELLASTTPAVVGEVRAGTPFEGTVEVHVADGHGDGPFSIEVEGDGEPALVAGGRPLGELPAQVRVLSEPLRTPGVHTWSLGQSFPCVGFYGFATVSALVPTPDVEVDPFVIQLGDVAPGALVPVHLRAWATDAGPLPVDDVLVDSGSVLAERPETVGALDPPPGDPAELDVLVPTPWEPGPFQGQLKVVVGDWTPVTLARVPFLGEVTAAPVDSGDSDAE